MLRLRQELWRLNSKAENGMKHYELYKDEELVSMYRDGDARAVDEIMERYKNLVRKKRMLCI